jgi:NTE family protein
VNPAHFVRASMSVPFFFHPYKVTSIPRGRAARDNWLKLARYQGNLPKECFFIDGAVMSNFPINLFHRQDVVPLAPTFGARLETDRLNPAKIETPLELITAIFEAARQTMDQEFVNQNPDYQKLITNIDTGRHHWLDFGLTDDDKKDLFIAGAQAAYNFLIGFDWLKYKQIREGIAKATIAARQ